MPAFSFQMLETYAERFDSLGKTFIRKLKSFDADAEIEFFHLIGLYALDVICGMFGICSRLFDFDFKSNFGPIRLCRNDDGSEY